MGATVNPRRDFLGLSFFLFILFIPVIAHAINIEGRMFNEFGPIKGGKVYVFKRYQDIKTGTAFVISGPTGEQGEYKMQLPKGEYYFTARANKNGREFFSYLGGNPVNVGDENIWAVFLANEIKPPAYSRGATSIRGTVTYKGKPVKGALVAFYTPENRKFKGIGYKTESVKEDGTFEISVPAEKYVVIARKKEGEKEYGPLKNGDLYCYYPGNPIEVKPGAIAQIEIPCYPKAERTSFVLSPTIKRNNYRNIEELASAYKYGIKGKVTDSNGEAVKGINVLAYKVDSANTLALASEFKGSHETENLGKTDEKGNYFIPLDADGNYVIMARHILGGGTPKVDEVYGFYNNTTRKGIPFKQGQIIESINITVVTPVKQNKGK